MRLLYFVTLERNQPDVPMTSRLPQLTFGRGIDWSFQCLIYQAVCLKLQSLCHKAQKQKNSIVFLKTTAHNRKCRMIQPREFGRTPQVLHPHQLHDANNRLLDSIIYSDLYKTANTSKTIRTNTNCTVLRIRYSSICAISSSINTTKI